MRYLILTVLATILGLTYLLLQLYIEPNQLIMMVVWVALLVVASILFVQVTTFILVDVLIPRRQGKQPSSLLRLLVAFALYVLCTIFLFRIGLNRDVAALLATSALLTAVAGFALQETLGNLFGGVSIQMEQPFGIGDWVIIDDTRGKIVSLNWRSTTIRTRKGLHLMIPNGYISKTNVKIIPKLPAMRNHVIIPAPIEIPPQRVIKLINRVVKKVPGVSPDHSLVTLVKDFDIENGAINYEVLFYPTRHNFHGIKSTIRKRVWYAFQRHGLTFPKPLHRYQRIEVSANEALPAVSSDSEYALKLLSKHPLFTPFSIEARTILAQSLESLMYAPKEEFRLEGAVNDALFLVARGRVEVTMPRSIVLLNGDSQDKIVTSLDEWEKSTLENVSIELAHFVGPIARHLVDRAAQRTAMTYQLYHMVAQDISDPNDQKQFLKNAPILPTIFVKPGEIFGEMVIFTGTPFKAIRVRAIGETELLKLNLSTIKPFIQGNEGLMSTLSHALLEYHAEDSPFANCTNLTTDFDTLLSQIKNFYDPVPELETA